MQQQHRADQDKTAGEWQARTNQAGKALPLTQREEPRSTQKQAAKGRSELKAWVKGVNRIEGSACEAIP